MEDSDLLITCESAVPSTSAAPAEPELTASAPSRITFCQKFFALLFMCLLGFGSYFCYDNPGALQNHFLKDLNLNHSDFMLLYSWYSWPNVVMCYIGGFLLDGYFGLRFGTCIYAFFVVLGQLICALGAFHNCFLLIIFGRFVFGIGGESLAVAQNNYAVKWFKGNVLNMVFGFQLSIARAGSAVNFLLMGKLYNYVSSSFTGYQCLGATLFIASSSCWISLISGVLLGLQDQSVDRNLQLIKNDKSPAVKLSDVKHFGKAFWLTTLAITFYYSAIFAFVALGNDFFKAQFNLKEDWANFVNSLLFLIAAFLAPVLGLVIDKFGKNVTFIFISLLLTILGHILLMNEYANPVISMCIIGVAYSMIACALWPLIALVSPEHLLGTAYGIAQSFQNLGSGVIQLVAGKIVDLFGYTVLEVYFIFCFIIALVLIVILWIYDWRTEGCLNMSSRRRRELERSPRSADVDSVENERLLDSDYGSEDELGRSNTNRTAARNDDSEETEQI